MSNKIPIDAFVVLREHFFNESGEPNVFFLRPKRNTQDDPLDEYIADNVLSKLGIECERSGPLVSPDIVLFDRPDTDEIQFDDIVAIELKKVSRAKNGAISRSSSIDYNSTPPCGKVRVYAKQNPLNRSCRIFLHHP